MATFVLNKAATDIADGSIDLLTDTLKVMLVKSGYVANRDDDVVDAGGANDALDHEISVSGYVGGWGGAGRKTLLSKTVAEDDANDRAVFDCADPSAWTLVTGETIAAAVVIKEGGANDTTSRLIAYLDIADTPTNGGTFTLVIDSAGVIHFSTV